MGTLGWIASPSAVVRPPWSIMQHRRHTGACVWASRAGDAASGGHAGRLLDFNSLPISSKINENHWKSIKIIENHENHQKSMKIHGFHWFSRIVHRRAAGSRGLQAPHQRLVMPKRMTDCPSMPQESLLPPNGIAQPISDQQRLPGRRQALCKKKHLVLYY